MTAYNRLHDRFARIATLGEAASVLGWDAAAMMPAGGGAARGDQLAVLAATGHAMLTDPAVAADLHDAATTAPWEAANLALMRHAHTRATALPPALVEARERANSSCEKIWRVARAEANFAAVRPALEEVVRLAQHTAQALAPALGLSPYDALMDGFQPGVTAAAVNPVFTRYATWLTTALPAALEHQARQPAPRPLTGDFAPARQEALCRHLTERAGLEPAHARLDQSTHPFCGGTPTDIRITTRYDPSDPGQAIMGVLHETGHALYERGLPASYARQPVGEAAGMAVHESQSLIMEMQACRGDAYLGWLGTQMHAAFGGAPADYACANLARLWRRVDRSLIRVDADEMTYPAHVILRFQLEQALIAGDLVVADLPGAWNDGLHDLLGVRPANDREGCLQDIHWYDGAFGYFPSYTLGAMAAAQLMQAARVAEPTIGDALAEGSLAPLLGWLRRHVHAQGSLMGFEALLTQATGGPLDPAAFEQHLASRYLP